MDAALDVLLHLSENDVNNMAVYDVFIKGILDYLDNLSLSQIRTLFNIFSLLALTVRIPILFSFTCSDKYTLYRHQIKKMTAAIPVFGQKSRLLFANSYRIHVKSTKRLA